MAVFFGFLALFVIGKGWRDMQRKIKDFTYFDKVLEVKRDTVLSDRSGNRFVVHAGGVWREQTRRPGVYALDGTVEFQVEKPVWILTPDSVRIVEGKGRLRSGRFPEIRLQYGTLIIGYDTLRGKNVHYHQGKILP